VYQITQRVIVQKRTLIKKVKDMKSDKKQTLVMIAIAFLIIAGIMLYVFLSAPRVYENKSYTYSKATTESATELSYPLNLNTATAEELATIEGLSEKNALEIVLYRDEIGSYTDVGEIMNIKGIGEKTYYKVAPYLEV
jgi:competence protein ComEA